MGLANPYIMGEFNFKDAELGHSSPVGITGAAFCGG